jgi:acetate kinase
VADLMRVLTVNAGSSSLKLRMLDGDTPVGELNISSWDGDPPDLGDLVQDATADAIAHRVVHGGPDFDDAVVVDDDVRRRIEELVALAPLHQPRALGLIDWSRREMPDLPTVACFDTAFHRTLPPAAATYALPVEWRKQWGLRRFGFHGLSHAYAVRRAAELLGTDLRGLRVATCHLGAGASVCAVLDGRSVDTSMGFTPLEGLVMATRSGSVDPGLLMWLLQQGIEARELNDALEHRSGLLGLSGRSGDMREVLDARAQGDSDASTAIEVYVHRLAATVASMAASLGGLDAMVFTGGVGEGAATVRWEAAERLAFLGVEISGEANAAATGDAVISPPSARVATVVVTAREDVEMAREARRALRAE